MIEETDVLGALSLLESYKLRHINAEIILLTLAIPAKYHSMRLKSRINRTLKANGYRRKIVFVKGKGFRRFWRRPN